MGNQYLQLEKLKKKQMQLGERIKRLEAAEKARLKKQDTRRKILIGAYYLDEALKADKYEVLVSRMDKFLVRDSDRALFELKPRQSLKTDTEAEDITHGITELNE